MNTLLKQINLILVGSLVSSSSAQTTNGDFASSLSGWTATGSVQPDGGAASFNGTATGADTANDGAISQTIPTVAGTTYALTFSKSASGSAVGTQILAVTAPGFSQSITVSKPTVTATPWSLSVVTFTATGPTSTITFRDASSVTNGIDLLLDNVSVEAASVMTGTTVTIGWPASASDGVVSYRLRYGTAPGIYSGSIQIGPPPALEAQATGLAPGVWYFAVQATNDESATGPLSDELIVVMKSAPKPPPGKPGKPFVKP